MINTNYLADKYLHFDISTLSYYKKYISTKDDSGIFPPYIPFVGEKYEEKKIFVYAMAQDVKLSERYLWGKTKEEKVKRLYDSIDIAPYPVILGLVGIYFYSKFKIKLKNFKDIENYLAITNYYKFSLNDGNDIHPENRLPKIKKPQKYWELSDNLSIMELNYLKPNVIISFNGRHNDAIISAGYNIECVNDPSWILRGARGVLKEGGSWHTDIQDIKNHTAIMLATNYVEQIIDINTRYSGGKMESLKTYLLHYYRDWTL